MTAASENEVSPFDFMAEAYDAWFEGEGKLIFEIELAAIRRILPGLPHPWLEVGVGSGRFAQALGTEMGIDPSPRLLEIAKSRGIQVFQAKAEDRFFEDESFGAVFLIMTLCFVQSPPKVLGEANRILKPGGKVVIAMVPENSHWGKYYQGKKASGHAIYEHANFLGNRELSVLLSDAGFSVETACSTLYQNPDEVKNAEKPNDGYDPDAGFCVLVAGKIPKVCL